MGHPAPADDPVGPLRGGAPARPLRADARRNRDRLLSVALEMLSETGPEVALETIARAAGVGIGTLYRHFPTREALVEATYRQEVDRLSDAAGELLAAGPPDVALRAWMDRFIDYIATKRGMAAALRWVIASGADPYAHSTRRLNEAVRTLVGAAAEAGVIRGDVDPRDVLTGLSGVSLVAGESGQREVASRLLDLLMDGLRYRAPAAGPDG